MSDTNFHVGSPPTAPNQAGSRKKRIWLGVGVMAAIAVVAFCCGVGVGGGGDTEPQVITTPTPVKVIEYLPAPSTAAAGPSPTVAAVPTKAAPATIEEGTWTVGDDFPAGTYKLQTAATSMCYWGIYKSGTNQANIIDNDIVTGGRPTVTLKRGQDFKSDCGTWIKVK